MSSNERIKAIELDIRQKKIRSQDIEHEHKVAVDDLLHENLFDPKELECGPYDVVIKSKDNRLVFDIKAEDGDKHIIVKIPITPMRRIIRDYFMICESYYNSLADTSKGKIEAIDMGRRGIHNEGAEMLKEMLIDKVTIDHATARRLFTLVCVLHLK